MPRTSACRAQRVVGAIAAAILAAVIRVRNIPQVDAVGAMTEHDQKRQSLAAKNCKSVRGRAVCMAELHSSRSIVLCLLVFDTETREQRAILCILTLTAAFVLWFGRRLRAFARKRTFATERSFVKRTYRAAALEFLMTHRLNFRPLLAQGGSGVLLS